MKTFIFILSLSTGFLPGNQYEEAMKSGLKDLYAARSIADYQQAVSKFQRISSAEPEEWLPQYYAAYGYVIMAASDTVPVNKDKYLDLSQGHIEKAKELQANNAEVLALLGFNHMIRVSVDPGNRGQQYSGLSMQALQKAVAIDSQNPRALYLLARMSYGTAQFFGSGTEEACKTLEKSLELFESQRPESAIAPAWGKNQAMGMKNACQ